MRGELMKCELCFKVCASPRLYILLIEGMINQDLKTVSLWAKQWLVDFNPNKT